MPKTKRASASTLIGETAPPARRRRCSTSFSWAWWPVRGRVVASASEFEHARIEWGERLAAVAIDEQRLIHDWLGQQADYARLVAARTGAGTGSLAPWEVAIFDRDRHLRLEDPPGNTEGLPLDALLSSPSASQTAVALTPAFPARRARVSLSVPVPPSAAGAAAGAGARLILSQDASISFNSMLSQSGPNLRSGESFLVDRAGGRMRLLTPVRFTPRSPQAAGGEGQGASEAAADGIERFGRFIDYRGENVLAVTRRIAGTPCGLVVKIDESEAMAPSRH